MLINLGTKGRSYVGIDAVTSCPDAGIHTHHRDISEVVGAGDARPGVVLRYKSQLGACDGCRPVRCSPHADLRDAQLAVMCEERGWTATSTSS